MTTFLVLLGVAVLTFTAWAFAVAALMRCGSTRRDSARVESLPVAQSRFFVHDGPPVGPTMRMPAEALFTQLENHVRLEMAAAQAFLDAPTPQALHRPTGSPLVMH
jgi:hypothetical protein